MTTAAPFQLFPALDPAVEDALRCSIERFGVIVPVVLNQHGQVLDGHHRLRLAEELGVECPALVRSVADEAEAVELAATLNTDRRHLEPDQRRELVADLRAKGHSLRAIAGAVGADPKTVRNDLAGGEHSPPDEVRGRDGKTYPSTRSSAADARREAQEREDAELREALAEHGLDGPVDPEQMRRIREAGEAVGPLSTLCRELAEHGARYEPADFAARFGSDITWPRVLPRVIAARDWLVEFTAHMESR